MTCLFFLGFSGLKRLAETIDREIEMLEKEVTFGLVVDTSGSKFSADIADDILEEVKTLKVDAEGKTVNVEVPRIQIFTFDWQQVLFHLIRSNCLYSSSCLIWS